jgi:hypothetical protein
MEKDKQKTSRANQSRSKSERPKVWVPPSSLDAPPAPDGFRYRWIRAESVGFQDTKNVSGRLRYLTRSHSNVLSIWLIVINKETKQ